MGQPDLGHICHRLSRDMGVGVGCQPGVPLICKAVHILLQLLLKVLLLALLIHGIPPCKAIWSALLLALALGAPIESLPKSHALSPRLSSAAVLRRLGQSLVVLRASLAASSSLEPESAWALLRAPGKGRTGHLACLHLDSWGYLTQPHDPTRQNAAPLRDEKTKAQVGGTKANAKNTEPRSRRKGTRSAYQNVQHQAQPRKT